MINAEREMDDVPDFRKNTLTAREVLEAFATQDQTGKFTRDINCWPPFMYPLQDYYEGFA